MSSFPQRLKHGLKRSLRRTLVRANGLGVGYLLRKLGFARGGGIVMTHCVGHIDETAYLPPDMKTSVEKVEALLVALARRGMRCVPVREVVAALDRGDSARDLLAFTMDDGYRDNFTVALPLLKKHGASGTVFVESRAVEERKMSWMHRYFLVCHERGERWFTEEYARRTKDAPTKEKLLAVLDSESARGSLYDLKRVLKYEADQDDREQTTLDVLVAAGRTDADIAPAYLEWGQIEQMDREGIEFGAHTIHHEILSRLDTDRKRREISESTRALRAHVRGAVTTFAYPFGRPWDYDEECFELLREEGYVCACAAIDGTNDPGVDRWQLRRLPLNDDIPLADILAEIDGTLPLFRRLLRIRI